MNKKRKLEVNSDLRSARPERQNKTAGPERPNTSPQHGICQTDLKDISADITELAEAELIKVKLVEVELVKIVLIEIELVKIELIEVKLMEVELVKIKLVEINTFADIIN
jgi:hypothetical protein